MSVGSLLLATNAGRRALWASSDGVGRTGLPG